MTEGNFSTEVLVEAAAHAAYEANRAYCAAIGELSGLSWADAEKWRPWASAPEWQRASTKNSVLGVIGGETPEQAHERWFAEKAADGWRYGPVRSQEGKEDPCFVPYEELPPGQKRKNRIRVAVVQAMISALGDRARSTDLPPLNAEMLQNNERAISAAAHALHEASRAYRIAIGEICHPGWQNIPDWQEANARGTVIAVIQGCTPEMAHERWRSQMELHGWSWGPEEDIGAKKHPCLARYSLLPPKHHAKSRLCVEVARAMLSALG
jgi:hypothetical protein